MQLHPGRFPWASQVWRIQAPSWDFVPWFHKYKSQNIWNSSSLPGILLKHSLRHSVLEDSTRLRSSRSGSIPSHTTFWLGFEKGSPDLRRQSHCFLQYIFLRLLQCPELARSQQLSAMLYSLCAPSKGFAWGPGLPSDYHSLMSKAKNRSKISTLSLILICLLKYILLCLCEFPNLPVVKLLRKHRLFPLATCTPESERIEWAKLNLNCSHFCTWIRIKRKGKKKELRVGIITQESFKAGRAELLYGWKL